MPVTLARHRARSADMDFDSVIVRVAAQRGIYAAYKRVSYMYAALQAHHCYGSAVSDEATNVLICYALTVPAGQLPERRHVPKELGTDVWVQ